MRRPESPAAVFVSAAIAVGAAGVIAVVHPAADVAKLALVSTWSLLLVLMLFLTGLAIGVGLSMGNVLDRFSSVGTTAVGGVSPAVVLTLIAIVNFWPAAGLYLLMGVAQKAFNYSTTRLLLAVAAGLLILTLGSIIGGASAGQVLLWGGNVVYLSAVIGWLVADAFRGEGV